MLVEDAGRVTDDFSIAHHCGICRMAAVEQAHSHVAAQVHEVCSSDEQLREASFRAARWCYCSYSSGLVVQPMYTRRVKTLTERD